LGVSRHAITHRVDAGRLHRLHSGVYAVGHRSLAYEGRWMAGVLAGGDGAVLSHRSAAALWGLRSTTASTPTEISSTRSTRSSRSLLRHCVDLPADEVTSRRGIPVTTASRTLLDLAAGVSLREFERAVREAEFLRLPDRPPLAELLGRYPRRRGARTVRLTLKRLSRLGSGSTRSPLEDRFLRFVARAKLPVPETNVVLRLDGHTYEADCLWRGARLIVEIDGHESHRTRAAFESDRERDRHLQVAGWTVIRVTNRQLATPRTLATDIKKLLCLRDESAFLPPIRARTQPRRRSLRM
jgi:Protein of unknown function (DUF559)